MKAFPAIVLLVTIAAILTAQTPASQDQTDVIRTNTNLIQVRAVVTDRAGKLIDNLKQDDFEVLENGKPQDIKLFSLETVGGSANSSSSTAPRESTADNGPVTRIPPRPARTIVLFVDTLHLSSISFIKAKQQLLRFVDEQITDQDLVAIATTSDSLGLFGQFMRDRKMLKYAIEKIAPFNPPHTLFTPYLAARVLSENPAFVPQQLPQIGGRQSARNPMPSSDPTIPGLQAMAVAQAIIEGEEGIGPTEDMVRTRAREILAQERMTRITTLKILKAVSERMATLPGQRLIAFLSDGFTLRDVNGSGDNDDFNASVSRAVRAGVVINSFYPQGLTTAVEYSAASPVHLDSTNPTLMTAYGSYMSESRTESEGTLRELAAETGGEAYLNSNDVNGQLQKMLAANEVYYALGYYLHDEADHKFRSIKVRVRNHPEYHIRTQRGYQLTNDRDAEVATTPEQRLLQAMMSPLPSNNIAVTSTANFLARAGDDATVSLDVHFDGSSIDFAQADQKYSVHCEVVVSILNAAGKVSDGVAETVTATFSADQLEKAKRDGFRYSKRVSLAPGIYQFRIGVRDVNSGLIGTSSSWANVPELHVKKPVVSDLFLGRQKVMAVDSAGPRDGQTAMTKLLVGPASFRNGDIISYRFVLYNSASESRSIKVEILNSSKVVYAGSWQPLKDKIIRKDNLGVELGGDIRMVGSPGVYTLRITIKDGNATVEQTKEFELQD